MLWIIMFLVGLFLVIMFRWQRRGIYKMSKQLKTDIKALPVIGHSYLAIGTDEDRMSAIELLGRDTNKHGGVSHFWLGPVYAINISNVEIIDLISKQCLEKHYIMTFLDTIAANSSFLSSVSVWRHRRKIINPTFRQRNLNQFVNRVFSRQSSIMVKRLREVDGKGTFALWKYINNYTLDSVLEAVLGVQLNSQYNDNHPILKAIEECFQEIATRICSVWLHLPIIYKSLPRYKALKKNATVLQKFVDQIIKDKRLEMYPEHGNKARLTPENIASAAETVEVGESRLKSLTEFFLETSEENNMFLTDLECREELLTLLMAGTDTSAIGACFAAIMLSRHPDIQERAYQELREVVGDTERSIEAKDLPRLKYLEAVIKETLRLHPPVPIIARNIDKDIQLSSNITAVPGVLAVLHIWAIHRKPEYWGEDAEVFRPERFLEGPLKHPNAFMPFSCGPRNCVGYKYAMMSMLSLIATLLRNYQLLPATGSHGRTEDPNKPLRLKFYVLSKDADGFRLQIKSRK